MDVVVLAIPKSRILAEVFVDLGVPHVICFDFSEEFQIHYSNYDSTINAPYECIYAFCQEFYKRLVKGMSVLSAVEYGKETMKNRLRDVNKVLKVCNLNEKLIGEGPVLLPEDFDHDQSLYGTKDWKSTELKKGRLVDMSKIRGPTNVPKNLQPFTGRRMETYNLAKYLVEGKIVSLYGPPGIGKSHLTHTVSYFLNVRYYFNNGNYYFDLSKVHTAEQCKRMLRDEGIEYMMEDTLLILDHVDAIWKKSGPQFRWWALDIANRFGATILLVSRLKIDEELQDGNIIDIKSIELGPLNEFESADLLIAASKRVITKEELRCESPDMTLHEALQHEPNLKNCAGIPQYIMVLGELLEYNTFETINIKREIPTWIRREIKRQRLMSQMMNNDDLTPMAATLRNEKKLSDKGKQKMSTFSQKSGRNNHKDYKKESRRQRKRREKREKRREERGDKKEITSPYLSKNQKRKLKIIQEEEELERSHYSSHKRDEYFEEGDLDSLCETDNMDLKQIKEKANSPPRKKNTDTQLDKINQHKSHFADWEEGDPDMKKTLSFQVKEVVIKEPKTKRKKSKSKSNTKSIDSKQEFLDKRRNFIPLRDSQVDDFYFMPPVQKLNKDDFGIAETSKSLDFIPPILKKKGFSLKVKMNPSEIVEPDPLKRKPNTGRSDPLKRTKFNTDSSDIIYERISEDFRSSLDDDDEEDVSMEEEKEEEKQDPPQPTTLYLPPVNISAVKKKSGFGKQKSADIVKAQAQSKALPKEVRIQPTKSIDPYLEESDEEMIDTNIKKFVAQKRSLRHQKNSVDDFLEDDLGSPNVLNAAKRRFEAKREEEEDDDDDLFQYKINISKAESNDRYDEELLDKVLGLKKEPLTSRRYKIDPFF